MKPVGIGIELGIGAAAHRVDRLRQRDLVRIRVCKAYHAQPRKTSRALVHDKVAREYVHAFEHHVVAMGDALLPVLHTGLVHRCRDQAEIAAAIVGHDVELPLAMIEVVLVVLVPRQQELRRALRVARGEVTDLGSGRAVRGQEQPFEAARKRYGNRKSRVLFLVHQLVVGFAEAVAVQAMGALGAVFAHIEQRAIVGGPCRRADFFDALRQQLPGAQVLHLQRVLTEAGDVR